MKIEIRLETGRSKQGLTAFSQQLHPSESASCTGFTADESGTAIGQTESPILSASLILNENQTIER
ncbi:hypothetical protein DHL47_10315 [Streptococcus panodentis]|uniref:Uncharacterized protein n=1 Tax=Streptococcus panodentis TaxID=1581472 RepID=A0ABS5AYP9_9STRE|nr:hypothetical protein [Streptococcus panodentis]